MQSKKEQVDANKKQKTKSAVEAPGNAQKPSASTFSQPKKPFHDTELEILTEKWLTEWQDQIPLSNEIKSNVNLKEAEKRYKDLVKKMDLFGGAVIEVEKTNASLARDLSTKQEMRIKLREKMNCVTELIETIRRDFDFANKAFETSEENLNHISQLYDTASERQRSIRQNITEKLSDNVKKLKLMEAQSTREKTEEDASSEQQEKKLISLQARKQYLEDKILQADQSTSENLNKLDTIEKRILQLETEKTAMQKILENYATEKQRVMEYGKKQQEVKEDYLKVMAELVNLNLEHGELRSVFEEKKRNRSTETFDEVTETISRLKEEADDYGKQIERLTVRNDEAFVICKQLEERNNEMKNLPIELSTDRIRELEIYSNQTDITEEDSENVKLLKYKLREAESERTSLLSNLTDAEKQLNQVTVKYDELENLAENQRSAKESALSEEIRQLEEKVVDLRQKKNHTSLETNTKIQDAKRGSEELAEKFKKEMSTLKVKENVALSKSHVSETKSKREAAKLKQIISRMKAETATIETNILAMQRDNDELHEKLNQASKELSEKDNLESNLKREHTETESKMTEELEEYKSKETEYLNKIEELKSKITLQQEPMEEQSNSENEANNYLSPKLTEGQVRTYANRKNRRI